MTSSRFGEAESPCPRRVQRRACGVTNQLLPAVMASPSPPRTAEVAKLNRQGAWVSESIASKKTGRHVHGFLQQTTSDDYREELAKERFETERLFIRKVLARKEAKIRRRAERGMADREAGQPPDRIALAR